MDKAKLTAICHSMSKKSGLPLNSMMLYCFLKSILKKLAQSKCHGKFTFEEGFLLSNVVGIGSRDTVDIDLLLRNMHLSEENILETIQELLEVSRSDDAPYKVNGISTVREDDRYGGFRVSILHRMKNTRQVVPLDIATGDVITPHPINYKYINAFGQENILIRAYSIETIAAEKIQTIHSRRFLNSRSKDHYGLYVIYRLKDREVGTEILKEACIRTFGYRKTELDIDKVISLMRILRTNQAFLERWSSYSKKNLYARDVEFEDVTNNGINIIERIKNQ